MPDMSLTLAVSRRCLMKGAAIAGITTAVPMARAAGIRAPASLPARVGPMDLHAIPMIDSHMHPVGRVTMSDAYHNIEKLYAGLYLPGDGRAVKPGIAEDLRHQAIRMIEEAPRKIGYFNYVARAYDVPATLAGFDSAIAPRIASDASFSAYVAEVLKRENITRVLLQAAETMPTPPATLIPAGRYNWTSVVSDFTKLSWVRQQGFHTTAQTLAAIHDRMERAVAGGCRGFKVVMAYYRPLGLTTPSTADAEVALSRLLAAPVPHAAASSAGFGSIPVPPSAEPRFDDDPTLHAALVTYEDYLLNRIYRKAGELGRPVIIHSAVALHPGLRLEFNDPRPLYSVFTDPDIRAAGTRFVVIHSGYPQQEAMGAFISQLPNVYTDVSFYTKYPEATVSVYRALLALGPAYKILHGSDANSIPDEIGYCASNSRAALAMVLREMKDNFGWTQDDAENAARQILGENARELFEMN